MSTKIATNEDPSSGPSSPTTLSKNQKKRLKRKQAKLKKIGSPPTHLQQGNQSSGSEREDSLHPQNDMIETVLHERNNPPVGSDNTETPLTIQQEIEMVLGMEIEMENEKEKREMEDLKATIGSLNKSQLETLLFNLLWKHKQEMHLDSLVSDLVAVIQSNEEASNTLVQRRGSSSKLPPMIDPPNEDEPEHQPQPQEPLQPIEQTKNEELPQKEPEAPSSQPQMGNTEENKEITQNIAAEPAALSPEPSSLLKQGNPEPDATQKENISTQPLAAVSSPKDEVEGGSQIYSPNLLPSISSFSSLQSTPALSSVDRRPSVSTMLSRLTSDRKTRGNPHSFTVPLLIDQTGATINPAAGDRVTGILDSNHMSSQCVQVIVYRSCSPDNSNGPIHMLVLQPDNEEWEHRNLFEEVEKKSGETLSPPDSEPLGYYRYLDSSEETNVVAPNTNQSTAPDSANNNNRGTSSTDTNTSEGSSSAISLYIVYKGEDGSIHQLSSISKTGRFYDNWVHKNLTKIAVPVPGPESAVQKKPSLQRTGSARLLNLAIPKKGSFRADATLVADIKAILDTQREGSEETKKKRFQIVQEIVTTEQHYVEALRLVVKIFVNPLYDAHIIPPEKINLIFGGIERLLYHHERFYKSLNDRLLSWPILPRLGDLFLNDTDFLVVYSHYVNNYNKAMETFKKELENPSFASFIQKCEKAPELNYQDLSSFLIQPIQRIPRYQLLLKDLIKNTDASQKEEHSDLTKSLLKIKAVAKYINEQKRETESLATIERMQNVVVGAKIDYSKSKFIKEGNLEVSVIKYSGTNTAAATKKTEVRYFFLMSNMILMCEEKKRKNRESQYTLKEKFPIEAAQLSVVVEDNSVFNIITEKKLYSVFAPTAKEKDHWVKALLDALNSSQTDSMIKKFAQLSKEFDERDKGPVNALSPNMRDRSNTVASPARSVHARDIFQNRASMIGDIS